MNTIRILKTGKKVEINTKAGRQFIFDTVTDLIQKDFDTRIDGLISEDNMVEADKVLKSKEQFIANKIPIQTKINVLIDDIFTHNENSEKSIRDAKKYMEDNLETEHEFYPGMKVLYGQNIITNIYDIIIKKYTNLLQINMFDKLFNQGEWKGTLVPSKWHRLRALMGSQSSKKYCYTTISKKKLIDIFPLHGTEDPEFPEAIAKGKLRANSVLNPKFWNIIKDNAAEHGGVPTITIEMMQTYPEFKAFKSAKPMEVISSIIRKKHNSYRDISYILDGVGRLVNLKKGFLLCVDDSNHELTNSLLNKIEIEVKEFQCSFTYWRKTINYIHKLRSIDGLCDSPIVKDKKPKTWNGATCTSGCLKVDNYNYCRTSNLTWDYSDCCEN
jgi:hypothetical protein